MDIYRSAMFTGREVMRVKGENREREREGGPK